MSDNFLFYCSNKINSKLTQMFYDNKNKLFYEIIDLWIIRLIHPIFDNNIKLFDEICKKEKNDDKNYDKINKIYPEIKDLIVIKTYNEKFFKKI